MPRLRMTLLVCAAVILSFAGASIAHAGPICYDVVCNQDHSICVYFEKDCGPP